MCLLKLWGDIFALFAPPPSKLGPRFCRPSLDALKTRICYPMEPAPLGIMRHAFYIRHALPLLRTYDRPREPMIVALNTEANYFKDATFSCWHSNYLYAVVLWSGKHLSIIILITPSSPGALRPTELYKIMWPTFDCSIHAFPSASPSLSRPPHSLPMPKSARRAIPLPSSRPTASFKIWPIVCCHGTRLIIFSLMSILTFNNYVPVKE
jgi:hypothetical protein